MGWEAVASSQHNIFSGMRSTRRVAGYSKVGCPNKRTRMTVCFQEPVVIMNTIRLAFRIEQKPPLAPFALHFEGAHGVKGGQDALLHGMALLLPHRLGRKASLYLVGHDHPDEQIAIARAKRVLQRGEVVERHFSMMRRRHGKTPLSVVP